MLTFALDTPMDSQRDTNFAIEPTGAGPSRENNACRTPGRRAGVQIFERE
jgi:hypothetical protein